MHSIGAEWTPKAIEPLGEVRAEQGCVNQSHSTVQHRIVAANQGAEWQWRGVELPEKQRKSVDMSRSAMALQRTELAKR